jgi:hypothetical protein
MLLPVVGAWVEVAEAPEAARRGVVCSSRPATTGAVPVAADERFSDIVININLMAVAGRLPRQVEMSLGAEAARQLAESDAIPVLKGSTDQMCERLEWLRATFGISYVLVADQLMDALAPVVSRLAGR